MNLVQSTKTCLKKYLIIDGNKTKRQVLKMQKINEERYVEKKRNLALGVAAVSAVTVFGIILTI